MPQIQTRRGAMWIADGRRRQLKPAALLIHGAGGTHLSFPAALRQYPAYDSVLPDLPGHGASAGAGRMSVSEYALDIIALMDALELDEAIIIGHSMGGAIAQWLALEHRQRVAALALIGTGARLPVNPALITGIVADTEATIANLVSWMWSRAASDELKASSQAILSDTDPAVLKGDFLACDSFDSRERLGEIRAPTLILAGENDRMTPLAFSEELARGIPGARLEVIAGASHMLALEKEAACAGAIQSWLGSRKS